MTTCRNCGQPVCAACGQHHGQVGATPRPVMQQVEAAAVVSPAWDESIGSFIMLWKHAIFWLYYNTSKGKGKIKSVPQMEKALRSMWPEGPRQAYVDVSGENEVRLNMVSCSQAPAHTIQDCAAQIFIPQWNAEVSKAIAQRILQTYG
jgi:hypothetical protein